MEFHDLGKHCMAENCGQQDFLPFKCNACEGTFCLEHRTPTGHSCARPNFNDKRVLECPDCKKVLKRQPGVDHDVLLARHLASGCTEGVRKPRPNKLRCSAAGCRGSEFVKVTCKSCHKNFCLRHRHEDEHNCKGLKAVASPENDRGAGSQGTESTMKLAQRLEARDAARVGSETSRCRSEAGEAAERRKREEDVRKSPREIEAR